MISNERPSPYGNNRSFNRPAYQYGPPKERAPEDTIKTETIQIERKTFTFTLKENPRGRFLRITEEVKGKRDNVIIPSTGLEDFQKILEEMVKTAAEIPEKNA